MLTVPDNRNEDNPAAADESTTTLAGKGVGSGDQDAPRDEPPTLDALAREGARRMLMTALEAEVTEYIERFAEVSDADGRRLVVRNGQARERTVTRNSMGKTVITIKTGKPATGMRSALREETWDAN